MVVKERGKWVVKKGKKVLAKMGSRLGALAWEKENKKK